MKGIVLLNMGGPDSLDAVEPFLKNLFSDRDIIRLGPSFLQKPIASLIIKRRLKDTLHAYSLIGGKSPLIEITSKQAQSLEKELSLKGYDYIVRTGMRYWHPFIEDTLRQMHKDGVRDVLGLSLYPQYSKATSGSTLRVFKESTKKLALTSKTIESWCDFPAYINTLSDFIREELKTFAQMPFVLFSAHSLPQRFVDEGDPYIKETELTVKLVVKNLGLSKEQYCLAYQSKTGPVKWVGPTTEDTILKLSGMGIRDVLIVPVSFVSDHIETLYEIDMIYKRLAETNGINLKRLKAFNTDKRFIDVLMQLVLNSGKDT
ncbi:MAG: ferrochelatase [Thermodesulfovibrionales bacterium]